MIRYKTRDIINILITVLLLIPCQLFARQATQNDCRALELTTEITEEPSKYADALLWKVSKDNLEPSYLFGTIHVSDPKIVNLPQAVSSTLNDSDIFVMEAIPELEESLKLTQMMFFDDGRTLKDYIDDVLFNKTAEILQNYQLSVEAVMFMKPWAAFLVMNYPVNQGMPLDLKLLTTAQQNGAEIYGLESLTEQGNIFSTMKLETQVQLLLDTVCNYEVVSSEFELMISLYLARDLNGLIVNSNKYSLSQETIYKDLVKRLLTDRNYIMADRMQTVLEKGNAFIAIGAMHLPGNEGVLSLLDKQGYQITSIY